MGPNLDIDVQPVPEGQSFQVVKFTGEFDKAGHMEIRGELDSAVDDFSAKSLVFDFSGLRFINSEGIGYLMEIHAHLIQRGRQLVIVGLAPNIKDVFEAIGIKEIMPIFADLSDFLNN
jgi:anti-anti-sigma factor